jgi:hypothetical protein
MKGQVKKVFTTDQRLLMEIRDHLEALPLAVSLKDVEKAKKMRQEIDQLDAKLARVTGLTTLLLRLNGVDATKLSDDEIALLGDAEAIDEDKLQELLST